ncbi:sensor histidine kinase [Nonomuraea sp. NPDC002799]
MRLAATGRSVTAAAGGSEVLVSAQSPEGTAVIRVFVPDAELMRGVREAWLALLAAERESVADLSHRLRTPLTGLRLDAESLLDAEEAARLQTRVDALQRAVSAVITEARQRSADRGTCDAAMVVRERVRFWSVLAEDQGREVSLSLPSAPLPVAVEAEDLAACVDALLGNVFAHTPEGIAMSVSLGPRHPSGALLRARGGDPDHALGPGSSASGAARHGGEALIPTPAPARSRRSWACEPRRSVRDGP